MVDFDVEAFLNKKYHAIDFRQMIGDIQDFLELSENTLAWQYHVEIQSIRRRPPMSGEGLTPHDAEIYVDQCLEGAEFRFKISLPMRVRYAALVSLVTAVESSSVILKKLAAFKVGGDAPTKVLKEFCRELSLDRESVLVNYDHLVTVKNTIVHAAGVKRAKTRHGGPDLASAIVTLPGFEIIEWPLLGDCVGIRRGALEPHIANMAALLPELYEAADDNHR